jgi:hypothetical protein
MSDTRNPLVAVLFLTCAIGLASSGQTTKPASADEPEKSKAVPAGAQEKKETKKKGRGHFTISKETTYVTGPVDKDGYIDYAAALNERLRQGVTPENNANVLIWKALGPKPEGGSMPTDFFKLLGIHPPPEKGDYFVDLDRYIKDHLKMDPKGKEAEDTEKQLDPAVERAWTEKEHLHLAAWIELNKKPLAVIMEATKRSHYFSPLAPGKWKEGSAGLMASPMPGVQKCRGLSKCLAARAMLILSEGKYDDAWQDLLACHRLARLVGRGATLIDGLVGMAIENMTATADLAFLERVQRDPKRIESCLRDLKKLPPFPGIADKVNLGERFMLLDVVFMVDRHGFKYLEALSNGHAKDFNLLGAILGEAILRNIDWDPALRNANNWYDRMTTAARGAERTTRKREWNKVHDDLLALKGKVVEEGGLGQALLEGKDGARGKAVGDVIICLMVPAVYKVQDAADRSVQTQDNLQLAFALALYHCDHKQYPKSLDALAPKYLPKVPEDMFSGKPLVYRPTENGYLLYSVGMNGKDDGGRGYDDDPSGDDLVIRMPLPEWKAK